MSSTGADQTGGAPRLRPLPEGPDPAGLMATLAEDVRTLRVGNSAPESVPVFHDKRDPSVRYVRFSDLSANLRHIMDLCGNAEIRIDGSKEDGQRAWRDLGGRRGPVLQWHHRDGATVWRRRSEP